MKKSFFLSLFLIVNIFCLHSYECPNAKKDICDIDLFKKCEKAIFVDGEFLYWTAEASSLDYAVKNNKTPPTGTTYANGEYQIAEYDWDPGLRVAIGYFNAPNFYHVLAQFTHVEIKNSEVAKKPDSAVQFLNSTFPQPDISSNLTQATSKLTLRYDMFDLLFDRPFIPNPHLRLKLFGGASMGRLKNSWFTNYLFVSADNNVLSKWKFLAGGFKLGLFLDWFLGKNFYLTGKMSASALIGRYTNTWQMKTSITTSEIADVKYKDHRISYNTDFLLGPSYQISTSSNRIEIFIGYELNSFFNLHEVFRSTGSATANAQRVTTANGGTLSLHGLDLRLTVDF
ncbi:MAG: hypothetical protein JXA94_07625 [Parachlamydiales bacterium]|nr:hypothetical protein [Parachlamydiales bacterium]